MVNFLDIKKHLVEHNILHEQIRILLNMNFLAINGSNANSNININSYNFSTTGIIQAEQLTSTDDITMLGHRFTLGDGSDTLIELIFQGLHVNGKLTWDETAEFISDDSLTLSGLGSNLNVGGNAIINGYASVLGDNAGATLTSTTGVLNLDEDFSFINYQNYLGLQSNQLNPAVVFDTTGGQGSLVFQMFNAYSEINSWGILKLTGTNGVLVYSPNGLNQAVPTNAPDINVIGGIGGWDTDIGGTSARGSNINITGGAGGPQLSDGGTGGDGGNLSLSGGAGGAGDLVDGVNGIIQLKSDTVFVGSGSGLPFAEIYGHEVANEITITGTGIANKVQITSFATNGLSNNCTPDHTNDHITILKAGVYKLICSISAESVAAGGADTFGFAAFKNNGATEFLNTHINRKLSGGGGDVGSITLNGLITCAVNDTIEVWVWNNSSTDNIVIDDICLNLVQIGG